MFLCFHRNSWPGGTEHTLTFLDAGDQHTHTHTHTRRNPGEHRQWSRAGKNMLEMRQRAKQKRDRTMSWCEVSAFECWLMGVRMTCR